MTNRLRACEKRILIGMDRPDDVANSARQLKNLSFEAFGGNRRALMWRTLGLALHHPVELALIGHVNYAPFGLLLRRLQPQTRYGVILYGIDAWERLSPLKRRALQKADFLIAISETTRQKAAAANELDAKRIYVLPNALEWAGNGSASSSSGKGRQLLSVCRLDKAEQYKGIDVALKALPKIAETVPDVRYVIVGGGSDLGRHQELANELGIADRVVFTGFVSDETLRGYYRDSDVFIMPSSAEGFGFVFLEAMYHRKPVVAAHSGATPEVVLDGETGLLVEYGNVNELSKAIASLCLDANLRERLGGAGQIRLQANFSFQQFKERFEQIVMRELGTRATANKPESRNYLPKRAEF